MDCADAGAAIEPSANAETAIARMIDFMTFLQVGTQRNNGEVMYRLAIALFALSLVPARAFAWGSEGHRIVAEIAEQHLEPATAKRVRDLLFVENSTSLAAMANWADQIKPQRRETALWHFVDIPISAPAYDPARDCAGGNCVVSKIEQFAATLHDTSAPPQTRLEALKFLAHFVGDAHQPLHASDNNDRGGNEVHVTFNGHRSNLHAVWDTGILAPAVNDDERSCALGLHRQITLAETASWQTGTPAEWANESHAIAVKLIYAGLAHSGTLPADYERTALPVIDEQRERAGIRLAVLLDQALNKS
jgi:hypothetical protein